MSGTPGEANNTSSNGSSEGSGRAENNDPSPSSPSPPSPSASSGKPRSSGSGMVKGSSEAVVTTTRQFAPLPHHRRPVREFQSAEETMIQPEVHRVGSTRGHGQLNPPTRQKSFSTDALNKTSSRVLGSRDLGGVFEPNSASKSYLFNGTFSSKAKISPDIGREVITGKPILGVTTSEVLQGCGKLSDACFKRGETCVNIHLASNGSIDSMENICRICHDSPSNEKLIRPCLCKGSMGQVHRSCLERWLGESGKASCEICGQEFNTVRVPKHKGIRSILAWIRRPLNPTDSRNFFFDLACFFVLTPLALLSGWLCIVGAQTYASEQQRYKRLPRLHEHETLAMRANRDISNSTWTSIGLLSLTGTLVAAYMIWIFVAFRYHLQVWREWQQRNYIVTIIPLANGQFCFPPPPPQTDQQQREGRQRERDEERRQRNHHRASDDNMNANDNNDEGSPTTRFIHQVFIPSLTNDEAYSQNQPPPSSNNNDNDDGKPNSNTNVNVNANVQSPKQSEEHLPSTSNNDLGDDLTEVVSSKDSPQPETSQSSSA